MSEWISVDERLPEKSDFYFTYDKNDEYYAVLHFSERHKRFNAYDGLDNADGSMEVTHWMPLQAPQEAAK